LEKEKLLECIQVSKEFGGLQALKNVDLLVKEGEITGLVGPNGSGKSTLLNLISGVYKPDSGKVLFLNEEISRLPSYAICARGIAKTSQSVQSFPDMTTMENVLTSVLFAKSVSKYAQNPTDKAKKLIEFVGLGADKLDVPAKNLNVVELRRVQLARALATNPKLLLLDELLTGLTPKECDEAIALVKLVNKQGASVLMVEHIMKVVMGLCNRVVVLHHGEKICEGPPEKVCADKNVINVYLGKKFLFDEE
jgi:branched-chain amino acid transport system ATP-binding protein